MSGIAGGVGSNSASVGWIYKGTIGPEVHSTFSHITTINMDVQPYVGSAGGTIAEGGDIFIHNLGGAYIRAASGEGPLYQQFIIYFDSVTASADTELRVKVISGTNTSSSTTRGFCSNALLTGTSLETGNWYQGVQSGPDQDGGTHNSNSTTINRWMFRPPGDLLALGDIVMRVNVESKKAAGPNTWGQIVYGYCNGSHQHTDTAAGPYHTHGKLQGGGTGGSITNFFGFLFQVSAGTWNGGRIRVYGRRND